MSHRVLITGASRGIGAATARLFAQEGWDVALNYNQSRAEAEALAAELSGLGVKAVPMQADISVLERSERLVREAEGALGPLDAVVCNAGTALVPQLFTDTTVRQWRNLMDIDLDGMFYTLRAAIPGLVRQKRGAIVTVSSMWGVTGGACEAPYSAAKAGVIGLTKALAKELGPPGITVNCLSPGVIDTEMNANLTPADLEALAEETPLGCIGRPEDVAGGAWFLASEEARFLTGQVLAPNGGLVI